MEKRVLDTIDKHNLIKKGDNVLVGVSGGPDSMALLNVLYKLSLNREYKVYVAHINHGIRGEEADKDEDYVKNICEQYNIPFYSKKVNMNEYAKKHGLSSEEAGREIRYSFFRQILSKLGDGKIAVAHNKNDQAETLIMRFIRGTGIDGLRGMEYKNGEVIRPLLDISRHDIEAYCISQNLNPRTDKTNLEPVYSRNRVRLELIPYIEEHFNEGIIDTLSRISRIMNMDSDFINTYSINAYENTIKDINKTKVSLKNEVLKGLHPAIKSRIIRYSIKSINGSLKGIEEKHISDIVNLIDEGKTGKSLNLPNNIIIRTSYDIVIIEKNNDNKITNYCHRLQVGGKVTIDELNAEVSARILSKEEVNFKSKERFIKFFDYDKIEGDLLIRNRRAGDRFVPSGMKGSKKLKDYFIDEKVPREERDRIPLVENNGNIIWIIGCRVSDDYKATSNTKNFLVIECRFK